MLISDSHERYLSIDGIIVSIDILGRLQSWLSEQNDVFSGKHISCTGLVVTRKNLNTHSIFALASTSYNLLNARITKIRHDD